MQCPGQDSRYWDSDAVFETSCPTCGNSVEFFKDDSTRKCGNCGQRMVNPHNDFGCAAYCPHAEQCLSSMPPELLAKKQELLKERAAIEMKRHFGADFKGIGHATRMARHAEQICRQEEGANPAVVLISAYLHGIDLAVTGDILTKLGAPAALITEVCDIIGHLPSPRAAETANFKVLFDAGLIAELEEKHKETPSEHEHLQKIINTSFLTKSGAQQAAKLFLQ
ncbi:MAG: phosphohydrolase [Desulfobulbaceae bacterium]|nr:phosphohydrolase [Desulfobulbaceae bacterium]HIJ78447.1 phosphohydrolase [Deltaproteobacteria bacterium]